MTEVTIEKGETWLILNNKSAMLRHLSGRNIYVMCGNTAVRVTRSALMKSMINFKNATAVIYSDYPEFIYFTQLNIV